MAVGEALSKVFDVINKVCAFVILVVLAISAINSIWTFIDNETVLAIFGYILRFGPLIVCSLVMVEFAIKRNILLQILIYLIIAVAVIFQFFPDTFNTMVGSITDATSALGL